MKTIWKYDVGPQGAYINAPAGARFIHVDHQAGLLCVWAEVDPEAEPEQRVLRVVGTGHQIPDPGPGRDLVHVGSAQIETVAGQAIGLPFLVWHVYEDVLIDEPF